jgi:hypothetical protein
MNDALHQQRARQAWPILIRAARTTGPMTYGQLGAMIGVHHRVCSYFLSRIQDHCEHAGLPALQVLVANKHTKMPGAGFHACRRTHREIANMTRLVQERFRQNVRNPF